MSLLAPAQYVLILGHCAKGDIAGNIIEQQRRNTRIKSPNM